METQAVGVRLADRRTHTVSDNHGMTSSAVATVTVTINDAGPTASPVTASTTEDASTVVTASAHAEDLGDSIVSYGLVSATSAHGAAVTNNDGGAFRHEPGEDPVVGD